MADTRIAVGGSRGTAAASLIVEAFGDAVVPQISQAIGRAILRTEAALPRGVPLIKRVLALGGTTVCRSGSAIVAYGMTYREARAQDTSGRPLLVWRGCRRLGDGEAFFMNWDSPDSFDSRYFGPLPFSTVIGRAIPLWTDEDGAGRFEWRTPTR